LLLSKVGRSSNVATKLVGPHWPFERHRMTKLLPLFAGICFLATAAGQVDEPPSITTDDNGNVAISSRLGGTVTLNGVNLIELVSGLAIQLEDLKAAFDQTTADLTKQQNANSDELQAQAAKNDEQAVLIAAQGELIAAQSDALDASGAGRSTADKCLEGLISALSASKPVDKLESCPTPDTPTTTCDPLDTLNNGEVHGHGTTPGSVRIISCNENYVRNGPEMVVCLLTGAWSTDVQCTGTTTTTTSTTVTTTTTVTASPFHSTCLSWYNEGARESKAYTLTNPDTGKDISAWCDMEDDKVSGLKGGWTLIGITNGKPNTYDMPFNANAPEDAVTGHYTKDLVGRSFTAQRYECGTSIQGVKGSLVDKGKFSWTRPGDFSATVSSTSKSDGLVWKPRLPGDSARSDADGKSFWNNHYNGAHFPTFGITGFKLVDGRTWGTRYCFTCNPTRSSLGRGDTEWFNGATGVKFVRYWLR